jgi:hypothetical protein
MSALKTPEKILQQAVDLYHQFGEKKKAADYLKIPYSTLRHRLIEAEKRNILPNIKKAKINQDADIAQQLAEAQATIRALETAAKSQAKETLSAEYVKKQIIKLTESNIDVPNWLVKLPKKDTTGVPTLFASDWHWAENEYNIQIAQERARAMVETAIDLLRNHLNNPEYPGIVFALGGDMFSGNIHQELATTNDIEVMPSVLDLWGILVWCIETLANEFGKVFVPCVTGNHGRNTFKFRLKTATTQTLIGCFINSWLNDLKVISGCNSLFPMDRTLITRFMVTAIY